MNKTESNSPESPVDICLTAKKITKIYPGTVALRQVDFNVYKGKVTALIGENGAGKSTLMKIIAGIEEPNEGSIHLNGEEVYLSNPRDAAAKGIGIIHQDLNLFPNLNVAQNIFMAHENVKYGFVLDHKAHFKETQKIMERLEQHIEPGVLVGDLRVGQQQIVEIAKNMARRNLQVLIMDEPTSSLSAPEVEILFKLIKELKEDGVSIVYISHRLEEIMTIADYVTILRDGNKVAEAKVDSIDISWIIKNMVGRETLKLEKKHQVRKGQELLRVEELTLPRPGGGFLLDRISFTLQHGEILGIYGLLGAGRTELIETLMGLHPEATGYIYINGKKHTIGSVWEQIRLGLAQIPEDRQRDGLVQILSVENNITLASLENYTRGFHLVNRMIDESVDKTIKDLEIKVADSKLSVSSLSGGNQQKVVIGKGLLTMPSILLLDEPTRGIDIGAKTDVFRTMDRLASQGMGIIVVASELKEIMAISDRVIVMSNGKLISEYSGGEITEEALVAASSVGHGLNRKKIVFN